MFYMAMHKLNEYLSVGDAAQFLGVNKMTLRRWDKLGQLTAYRQPISGYRLYLKADLKKLLLAVHTPGGTKWKK